jgi:hypothetical protein
LDEISAPATPSMAKQDNKENIFSIIWNGYVGILKSMGSWFDTKPHDSLLVKILKGIGKVFTILTAIILSPVVATTMIIAFFLAL